METPKNYCPNCGRELKQGEYAYDENTGNTIVEYCPECGCEGLPVKTGEEEDETASSTLK